MTSSRADHKILLDESEMPTQWYNWIADLPSPPPPPLHPGTHEPIGPEALAPLFPHGLDHAEAPRSATSISRKKSKTSTNSGAHLRSFVPTVLRKHLAHGTSITSTRA